jgi:hypothetical protein
MNKCRRSGCLPKKQGGFKEFESAGACNGSHFGPNQNHLLTDLRLVCRQYGHFDPVPRNFRIAGHTPRTLDLSVFETSLVSRSRH